jgi:hypothetical protein
LKGLISDHRHPSPSKLQISEHLFGVFVLLLLLFLFLLPVFLENRTLIDSADIFKLSPWDTVKPPDWYASLGLDGSATYLFHPSDLLARDLARQGTGFAWNPYVGFGAPWIGAMQAAPYFPPKVIQYVLPFWEGADLVRILLLFLAGLGSYLLAISLDLGQEAALVSAVSYMFCQRLFLVINLPTFQVETLLPLMLFGIHRMVMFRSWRYAIFVGWIGASQLLAGFPESSFIFCLLSAAFFLFLILQAMPLPLWKSHVALGAIAAATAVLLSGFQLGEFARYLSLAHHAHAATYGLGVKSPIDLIRVFVPYYFGFPFERHWAPGVPPADHMYLSLFGGITTVVLATIGVLGGHFRRGRWFFFACLVIFAGYDYGFPGLRQIGRLPFFRISSISWNAFVIPFTLSVLAGFGMHTVLNGQRIWRRTLLAVSACIVLLGVLISRFPLPPPEVYETTIAPSLKWFSFGIAGFLVALAWLRSERYKWSTPWLILVVLTIELYHADVKLDFVRQKYYATNPPALNWFLEHSTDDRILGLGGIFPADTLLPSRVRDIRHFDAMYPKLYVDFADAVWPGANSNVYSPNNPSWQRYQSKLLDLAAVRYIFSPKPLTEAENLIDIIMAQSEITTFDRRLVNTSGSFVINGDRRRILFEHPPATVKYGVKVPAEGKILFSIGEEPSAWQLPGEGTIFEIAVGDTLANAKLKYRRYYDPKHNPSDRRWVEGAADLSTYAGKVVNIFFITKSGPEGSGSNASAWDGWAGIRWGPEEFTQVYSDTSVHIYRNNNAIARARFVPAFRSEDKSFMPSDMEKPDFDIRREVFLKNYAQPAHTGCQSGWEGEASAKTLQDDPDLTRFRVVAPCNGFFVLADLYYPGWTATVDGRPAQVYKANYAFRAVALGEGRHEIVFRYAPWTLSIGVPAAFFTLIGSSLLMLCVRNKHFASH